MKTIEEILLSAPQGVLSLTGGGGKTSLMFYLARQLSRAGMRVLTTTTTKIFFPTADQSTTVLIDSDPKTIIQQASSCRSTVLHVTAAAEHMTDSGKLKGFPPEAIRTFEESGLFDWILVEADGSARRPLKAPAGHEPVIPPNTTVLVAVAGLEVLGKVLTEDLVFRSEIAGKIMKLSEGETINESNLASLFSHPLGPFKGAPPRARCFIFLNKADNPERIEGAKKVAEQLRRRPHPVAEALLVGQALDNVRVHAEHPLPIGP